MAHDTEITDNIETTYRVQEFIERSSRYHVYFDKYTRLINALLTMRVLARRYRAAHDGTIETDNNTYIQVRNQKGSYRRFTIISGKRGSKPVEFGHLLKQREVTE